MSEFREQLLAERSTGIGGSDVADVMNEPPYGCSRRLVFEKLDVARDYEDDDRSKAFMARGRRLEEVVAEEYTARTQRVARRAPVRRMREAPWRLVHIDRLLTSVANPPDGVPTTARTAPLECKVPGEFAFKRIVNEGLSADYILQGQWGMLVFNFPWMAFGIFWADRWTLLDFDVTRNEELGRLIADAVDKLWALIIRLREAMAKGAPLAELALPDRLPAGDDRCGGCAWRRTCWGDRLVEILRMVKAKEGKTPLEPAPDLTEIVTDYVEAKRILDADEELVETIGGKLREQIGERQAVTVAGFPIYYRLPKPSVMLDMDAMRADMPPAELESLFRKYGKAKKQTRSLRVIY